MSWNQLTLSQTTTVGTFAIKSLPGTSKEEFVNALSEVLSTVTPPGSQRDTNVVSQQLLTDDTSADGNTCFWALRFNGIHAPDAVRSKCEAMYEGVREKLEAVGTRASFSLSTLQGEWTAE